MKEYFEHFVSIDKHEKLYLSKRKLHTANNVVSYDIVRGVPIILPETVKAKWHRELIEIILWEHPDEIEKIYKELKNTNDYSTVYIRYIRKILKDKQGIIAALEKYSQNSTDRWITENYNKVITNRQKHMFNRYALKSTGKKRTETKINAVGLFEVYPHFGKAVNLNSPKMIVELGTGAGGGTASVALQMNDDSLLFTVDIGFECLGNAVSIAKFQKKKIVPVCANFWYLPFADNSMDSVCTYNGLDESRENERTIAEISRILKPGGRFTVVSRKNAFTRQSKVLEPFGFTQKEVTEFMKKCRVYSDINTLAETCKNHSLVLESQKEFDRGNNLVFVLSQFVKE